MRIKDTSLKLKPRMLELMNPCQQLVIFFYVGSVTYAMDL